MNKKELDEIFESDYYKELLEEIMPILKGEMTQEEFFEDTEEEKEEYSFPTIMEMKDEKQEVLEDTCNKLVEMLQAKIQDKTPTAARETINLNNEDDMLGKEDIKRIMGFKDDGTALKFFRVAMKYGYAIKLNKSFIISRRNLKIFLKHLEGQEFTF